MGISMKEKSSQDVRMVKGNILGVMELYMMVLGRMIKRMAKVPSQLMVKLIRDSFRMIK